MTAPAWVALGVGITTLLVNIVFVVRFVSRLESRLDVADERFSSMADRVKKIERAVDEGRVVVFSGPAAGRRRRLDDSRDRDEGAA